jgi:hypothetical protein
VVRRGQDALGAELACGLHDLLIVGGDEHPLRQLRLAGLLPRVLDEVFARFFGENFRGTVDRSEQVKRRSSQCPTSNANPLARQFGNAINRKGSSRCGDMPQHMGPMIRIGPAVWQLGRLIIDDG